MIFSNDRNRLRQFFFDTWQKAQNNQPLEPLEHLVASIIDEHPEYHSTLNSPLKYLERDYLPEMGQSNPFLHMGMHISIQEQVQTNRPQGITALYKSLCRQLQDSHGAEHLMMECLAQSLHEAQRTNTAPDEQRYLKCLKNHIKNR